MNLPQTALRSRALEMAQSSDLLFEKAIPGARVMARLARFDLSRRETTKYAAYRAQCLGLGRVHKNAPMQMKSRPMPSTSPQ